MFEYLKRVDGAEGQYQGGAFFSSVQGEHFYFEHRFWSSVEGQMFVIQVESGAWLASTCAYENEPRYDNRAEALRAAAANVQERVKIACITFKTMPADQANAIAQWAASIANSPPPAPIAEPAKPEPRGQMGLFGR